MRWSTRRRSRSSPEHHPNNPITTTGAPSNSDNKINKSNGWNCLSCGTSNSDDSNNRRRMYEPLSEFTPRDKRRLGYDVIRPATQRFSR